MKTVDLADRTIDPRLQAQFDNELHADRVYAITQRYDEIRLYNPELFNPRNGLAEPPAPEGAPSPFDGYEATDEELLSGVRRLLKDAPKCEGLALACGMGTVVKSERTAIGGLVQTPAQRTANSPLKGLLAHMRARKG